MKAKKWGDLLLILFSSLFLSLFGLFLFLLPQRTFSESENRALTTLTLPEPSQLLDGSFSRRFGLFCADQFPLRSHFVALSTRAEQLLGKQEQNGILFGKGGFLIPRGEVEDLSILSENLRALEALSFSATALFVPRHVDVLTEQYPNGFSAVRSRAVIDAVLQSRAPILCPVEEWENRTEYYYKTDHHLTTEGAYAVYRLLGSALEYAPKDENFFEQVTISQTFLGTSHSRVGGIAADADTVVLYRYAEDHRFTVTDAHGATQKGFYRTEALSKKDHYGIFLGGNYPHLTITDPAAKKKPRLLLVKESYANALIPFLAIHFDLTVLDPRYRAERLPNPSEFDRVLILYGADTAATDPALGRLLLRLSS